LIAAIVIAAIVASVLCAARSASIAIRNCCANNTAQGSTHNGTFRLLMMTGHFGADDSAEQTTNHNTRDLISTA